MKVDILEKNPWYTWRSFKDSFCSIFCNRTGDSKCKGCPADKLTVETMSTIKIGDLVQERRKIKRNKK